MSLYINDEILNMEKSEKDIIQYVQIYIREYEVFMVNLLEESIKELSYLKK